ncbi:MAG: DUF1007 family protein [Hyphomicrobiaceae bacterium]
MIGTLASVVCGRWPAARAAIAMLALLPSSGAMAHPHIWVTTRSEVVIEKGAIVAIRQHWTFDQYYSDTAIDGLDTDKDGIYSRQELAELAKVNVEALKDFSYFTYPRLAGKDLAVGTPTDYWLDHDQAAPPVADAVATSPSTSSPNAATGAARIAADAAKPKKVLTLHFTLPLAKPVLMDAKDFTFGMGDPTFFIAFEPAQDKPVTLAKGAPETCRIKTLGDKPAEGAANPSKPGDLMAPQPAAGALAEVKFVAATEWQVICGSGS